MKPTQYLLILLILAAPSFAWSQSQALYNLGSAIPQNQKFNPSFIPEGRFVLGLPVISGVSAGFNAATSYDVIVSEESDSDDILNFQRIINNTDENSFFHANADITDLYLGFRVRDAYFSLFINERINADFHIPRSLVELTFLGADALEDRFFNINQAGVDAKYYREYGIGYAKQVSSLMRFGVRAKFLQGIYAGRSDRNAEARVRQPSSSDPTLSFDLRNLTYNTSGQDILDDGDVAGIISNASRGFALDLGMEYFFNRSTSFAMGVTDLGFISWKEAPENFTLESAEIVYDGVGEQPTEDEFTTSVEDSLWNVIPRIEGMESFITGVNGRSYISMFFRPTYQDQIHVTLSNRFVLGRIQAALGAGYTHSFGKYFTLGVNGAFQGQQVFDLGASMALNLGPVQWYMAYDNLLNIGDPQKMTAAQVSFGINFIFGRTIKKSKDPRQEIIDRNNEAYPDYPASRGTYTPIIREEGIYQIVKEEKRTSAKTTNS